MEDKEQYSRLIQRLRDNEPKIKDQEGFVDHIMNEVQKRDQKSIFLDRLDDLLFSWIYRFRWRMAMAAVSIFMVVFFIRQQLTIQNNLQKLETKLSNMAGAVSHYKQPDILQKHLIKIYLNSQSTDSITISRRDMESFLKEYNQILDENHNLKWNQLNSNNTKSNRQRTTNL